MAQEIGRVERRDFGMVDVNHYAPFGASPGQEPETPPATLYCWLVEGARGTYRQGLEPGGWGLGETMWMYIDGYWFKECRCLPRGSGGLANPPDICEGPVVTGGTMGRGKWSSDVDINRDGKNWERIDKCTNTYKKCGNLGNIGGVDGVDNPNYSRCGDYARCCFKGKVKVDDDLLSDGDGCWPRRSLVGPLTDYPCEHHIDSWLDSHAPNPNCDMKVDCSEDPPSPEDNEDVKCEEYVK